jgi:hypothetical protein
MKIGGFYNLFKLTFFGAQYFGAAGVGAWPQKFGRACRCPAGHNFGGTGGDALRPTPVGGDTGLSSSLSSAMAAGEAGILHDCGFILEPVLLPNDRAVVI